MGYQLLIDYMIRQQRHVATVKLEKESYREDELIRIKVPIQLPYYNNTQDFEKVYGAAEVEGVVYHYVKRRIWHDSLELLCLPDHSVKELQTAKTEFFRQSMDGSAAQSEKKPATIIKIVLPDYCQELTEFAADNVVTLSKFTTTPGYPNLPAGFHSKALKPPRIMG